MYHRVGVGVTGGGTTVGYVSIVHGEVIWG